MLIKTTTRAAKVRPAKLQDVQDFVSHEHHIAWHPSIDKQVDLNGKKVAFNSTSMPSFYTYTLKEGNQAQTLHQYLLLGQQGAEYIGSMFPETMNKPIEAMTLLVDSSNAFQTWTDPASTNFENGLATGKAILSAFDVFEPYIPLLQQYRYHAKVAGIMLNIADSVYMVEKEYTYR